MTGAGVTPIISGQHPDGHAVGAIIVTENERFLLQHRDQREGIWFPGFWGLFGGAIDPGEQPETALRRELQEELGLVLPQLDYFTQIAFDFRFAGLGARLRFFYIARIRESDVPSLRLGEGQDMALFDANGIRAHTNITPYDLHGLLIYINRQVVEQARTFSRRVDR